MAEIQDIQVSRPTGGLSLKHVSLPHTKSNTWDVLVKNGTVEQVIPSGSIEPSSPSVDGRGALLAPSFCHPHIHIDKAYLLSHPRYSHLQIEKGDFAEAMQLTGQAKSQFEHADLLERGQRLIDESVNAGVTHMRAFVEIDAVVMEKCLSAGIDLKRHNKERCTIQICAFAQLPLFKSTVHDPSGHIIQELIRKAANDPDVDVLGSTPYVEDDLTGQASNIDLMIDLAIASGKHLDFHLDYHVDREPQAMVWHVLERLEEKQWTSANEGKTIVLGHCTRLTLFDEEEWRQLARKIEAAKLPVSFVGLPTSDLFMMRTKQRPEVRATLDVPTLVKSHGLNACLGVNNIGNAFTPQGSCDPLLLACSGVGIYQAGTTEDAELLFQCVSTRARAAIGYGRQGGDDFSLEVKPGDAADFVLFDSAPGDGKGWYARKRVDEAVYLYDHGRGRKSFLAGKLVNDSA